MRFCLKYRITYWKCKGLECFCFDAFHSCSFRDRHNGGICQGCNGEENSEDERISFVFKDTFIVLMDEEEYDK